MYELVISHDGTIQCLKLVTPMGQPEVYIPIGANGNRHWEDYKVWALANQEEARLRRLVFVDGMKWSYFGPEGLK